MSAFPDFDQYNLPAIPVEQEGTGFITPEPAAPLGKDFLFDTYTGEFALSRANGLMQADEEQALRQWIINAIGTSRGLNIIFPPTFGSELTSLTGRGLPRGAMAAELPSMIREAVLFHDRIEDVTDMQMSFEEESVTVSFTVVLDDDAALAIIANLPITF